MNELLADELTIPFDKEVWISCNDPEVDSILNGTLLPKGTQDRTREFIREINKKRMSLAEKRRSEYKAQQEEYKQYLAELGLSVADDQCDDSISIQVTEWEDDIDIECEEIIQEETNMNKSILARVNPDIVVKPVLKPVERVEDIKQSVNLKIDPDLSATKNFVKLLR